MLSARSMTGECCLLCPPSGKRSGALAHRPGYEGGRKSPRSTFSPSFERKAMISKYATAFVVIGALLAPVTGNAEDRDKDRSSPTAWVKDSVITAKIKAEYAKNKQVSVRSIRVDTDDKGMVQLSGTAKNKAEKEKAAEIAKGIEGVISVDNKIRVVPKKQS
jgi:hypothetical protein